MGVLGRGYDALIVAIATIADDDSETWQDRRGKVIAAAKEAGLHLQLSEFVSWFDDYDFAG